MSFPAAAVANYLLDVAERHGQQLTPMKLQKLVYFAHGWHLALTGKPLINEAVEAWRWGPVIPSLWGEFRDYGNQPIQRRTITAKVIPDVKLRWKVVPKSLDDADASPEEIQFAKDLLDKVWEVYGEMNAIQLSNLSHEPDSPWHKVWMPMADNPIKRKDIPNEIIAEYFREQSAT
jgi:uncharacterized phage-associated protein